VPRAGRKHSSGHFRVLQPLAFAVGLAVVLWGPPLWSLLVGGVALFRFAACMDWRVVDTAESSR
jgi:hypothetical protein